MDIMFRFCFVVITILAIPVCLGIGNFDSINKDLVLKNVQRNVDISSQLVKIGTNLTLSNTGKGSVKTFLVALEPSTKDHLAFIGSQSVSSGESLSAVETKVQEHKGKPFWRIELKDSLAPGGTTVVNVEAVFTHQLTPYPAKISQKEKQLVIYRGNHYFYSPYIVETQQTKVVTTSRNIESYTKQKPVLQSETTITYGPYENISPFSLDQMLIHYENNSPMLTISRLVRVLEVSHWGNIAIEETVDLLHSGAVLSGPFSRYDYQRESQSGVSSVKAFKTVLPAAASDVYYRDEIGNISTSHMKIMNDAVELDLRPRFPLFGGWKTHYIIGYNVPSYEYLYNSGDDYLLKMRFVDHVFDDMVVDESLVQIILPEGAHSIKLETMYPVQRLPDSLHYTYLDTKGRPVISLKKQNLVENHIQDFSLRYKFPHILMLQEPLLVVLAFYLLFLLVIIYVRLDFSITKDEAGEMRIRVAGYTEKVIEHQYRRDALYQQFDEQLSKLKTSKDVNAFQVSTKSTTQDYKSECQFITDLATKLKADAPDVSERESELQKVDRNLRELYNQHASQVEKMVLGRMNRQQFVDAEHLVAKRKEECVDKIGTILKSL